MNKTAQEEVIEVVNKLFIYTDYRQWDNLLNEVLNDVVQFDMSSLGGGAPTLMKATAIRDAWNEGFNGIDAVHHQAGNYLVNFPDKSHADVYCYAIALHYKQNATLGTTREFVGSYNISVVLTNKGWRIDGFKYNLKYINGNVELK